MRAHHSNHLLGLVLGSATVVFACGALLAWLLSKFGLPSKLAVSLALGTLVALVSIGLLRTDHPTFEQLLQLPCYLIASALAFRPLTRWLAQRETPARKRS
ncbi:MAG TPA: hypothetical protein VHZ95_18055 [Polyangiales bacterium]|jgi:hypothetical protein|nr:hypothetical protein [Polyangiales bacterium]